MNLKELTKKIPFKWRVQSFSKQKPSATCVAYVDARQVMDLLDEVVGTENWQDDYRVIAGNLYAGIGILCGDKWVWKWDIGTESNTEKEKGQSSDAFKRAAVKWGIGRFLYSIPIQHVTTNAPNTGNNYPYIVDANGKRVWDISTFVNNKIGNNPPPQKESPRIDLKGAYWLDIAKKYKGSTNPEKNPTKTIEYVGNQGYNITPQDAVLMYLDLMPTNE